MYSKAHSLLKNDQAGKLGGILMKNLYQYAEHFF